MPSLHPQTRKDIHPQCKQKRIFVDLSLEVEHGAVLSFIHHNYYYYFRAVPYRPFVQTLLKVGTFSLVKRGTRNNNNNNNNIGFWLFTLQSTKSCNPVGRCHIAGFCVISAGAHASSSPLCVCSFEHGVVERHVAGGLGDLFVAPSSCRKTSIRSHGKKVFKGGAWDNRNTHTLMNVWIYRVNYWEDTE